MLCDQALKALAPMLVCEEGPRGARLTTHCLYPSFQPVRVAISKVGDGYRIHDDGGAYEEAWLHGREDALIRRFIRDECTRYSLSKSGKTISASVESSDWLLSAILSVANASSLAAHRAVARITAAAEEALIDRIDRSLTKTFGDKRVEKGVDLVGKSGGKRHFDFGLDLDSDMPILVSGVLPHMASVTSKYVNFADTEFDSRHKLAVFDKDLDTDNAALLTQVASVVPLKSLSVVAGKVLAIQ